MNETRNHSADPAVGRLDVRKRGDGTTQLVCCTCGHVELSTRHPLDGRAAARRRCSVCCPRHVLTHEENA